MWKPAPGFDVDVSGLQPQTRTALDRLAERVRAMGKTLQVTSAYRPEDKWSHGRGEAVDVWVPGLTHRQLAAQGLQAGFVGGYIPHRGNFIELATVDAAYSVPGERFRANGGGGANQPPTIFPAGIDAIRGMDLPVVKSEDLPVVGPIIKGARDLKDSVNPSAWFDNVDFVRITIIVTILLIFTAAIVIGILKI